MLKGVHVKNHMVCWGSPPNPMYRDCGDSQTLIEMKMASAV